MTKLKIKRGNKKKLKTMFKSLRDEDGGFVNEALEITDENGRVEMGNPRSFMFKDAEATTIQIARSKYDQQKLYDEMRYKKPASKSGESRNECSSAAQ